jgi:hypothetical protein
MSENPPESAGKLPRKNSDTPPGHGSAKGEKRRGRKPGVPNKLTADEKALISKLVNFGLARAQAWLDRVGRKNPARALALTQRFAEHIVPRLRAVELSGKGGASLPAPVFAFTMTRGGPGTTQPSEVEVSGDGTGDEPARVAHEDPAPAVIPALRGSGAEGLPEIAAQPAPREAESQASRTPIIEVTELARGLWGVPEQPPERMCGDTPVSSAKPMTEAELAARKEVLRLQFQERGK